MRFSEDELAVKVGRIVLVTLRPKGSNERVIKGRLAAYDDQGIALTGDAAVANPLEPPDDLAPPPSYQDPIERLGEGQSRKLRFDELEEFRWSGM